jgi:hypothetical protein
LLREGAFREGTFERRSRGGARARRICTPLPGGSGPPLDRHDDRSPRSSVDSRQIEAGNARQIRSQETRELELSQRRMRSPWREPQQSAGRRARPASRGVAQATLSVARCRARRHRESGNADRCCAAMVGCASRRSAPSFVAGGESLTGVVVGKARTPRCRENGAACVIASVSEAIQGGSRESWIASSLSLLAMTRTMRHCERQRAIKAPASPTPGCCGPRGRR